MGCFSPQFDDATCVSEAKFDDSGSSSSCNTVNVVSNQLTTGSSASMEESGSATHNQDEGTTCSKHISEGTPEAVGTLSVEGKKLPQIKHHGQQKISFSDVMCAACKQLLFRPVVLNCGHGILCILFFFSFLTYLAINNNKKKT